jgi:hypothetical protein
MKSQFNLAAKNIKRDRIEKEIDLLILPLKTIFSQIDSRGIDKDFWKFIHSQKESKQQIALLTTDSIVRCLALIKINILLQKICDR